MTRVRRSETMLTWTTMPPSWKQIHAGEVGAFEVLYRHVGAVAMVARDQVRDPDQVAEVVQ